MLQNRRRHLLPPSGVAPLGSSVRPPVRLRRIELGAVARSMTCMMTARRRASAIRALRIVQRARQLAFVRLVDGERHLDDRRRGSDASLRQLGLLETDHGAIGADKFDLDAIDAIEALERPLVRVALWHAVQFFALGSHDRQMPSFPGAPGKARMGLCKTIIKSEHRAQRPDLNGEQF